MGIITGCLFGYPRMPEVSIITVCRNAERDIADCVASVAAQPAVHEHLVIDGHSSDRTLDILERCSQPGLRVISEPDAGMYDALNKGIQRATGEVIGILHADDRFARDDVVGLVEREFVDPSVAACYGDLEYVSSDDQARVIRRWRSGPFSKDRFLWGWMPPHPTFFARKVLFEKLGGYRLDLGTAADYELMLRFLYRHDVNPAYIPEVLTRMRVGGQSNAGLMARLRANRMDREAWRVNDLRPYPWTIAMKPLRKLGQWLPLSR